MIESLSDIDEQLKTLGPLGAVIQSVIGGLQTSLHSLEIQNQKLTEELAEMRRMMFGQRSERVVPVEREVRRVMSENELTPEEKACLTPEEKQAKRRKKSRARSENERRRRKSEKEKLPVMEAHVPVLPEFLPDGMVLSDFRQMGYHSVIKRVEHVREL